jgi:hypothetical protein
MSTTSALSLGQAAQNINNLISFKLVKDSLLSTCGSAVKSVLDTAKVALPNLTKVGNTGALGLGLKALGLGLAGYSAISGMTNLYSASKDLAGSPSYDTASGNLLKAGLDGFGMVSALGLAFGKVNALPLAIAYASSGIAKEGENLMMGNSSLMKIPVLSQLFNFQAHEGAGYELQNVSKLTKLNDKFIEMDNAIRKRLGFSDYLLRTTDGAITQRSEEATKKVFKDIYTNQQNLGAI